MEQCNTKIWYQTGCNEKDYKADVSSIRAKDKGLKFKRLTKRLRSNSTQMSFFDTNFLCKTFPTQEFGRVNKLKGFEKVTNSSSEFLFFDENLELELSIQNYAGQRS